jgi:hypothetical protein
MMTDRISGLNTLGESDMRHKALLLGTALPQFELSFEVPREQIFLTVKNAATTQPHIYLAQASCSTSLGAELADRENW